MVYPPPPDVDTIDPDTFGAMLQQQPNPLPIPEPDESSLEPRGCPSIA
jgi:hypothetical protein